MFLLCAGEGITLDTYVFSRDQLYAERLSAKVLRLTRESLSQSMRLASMNLRRDNLWTFYSTPENFGTHHVNAEEALELCQLCSQTELALIDPRLTAFLFDESEMVNWSSTLFSMKMDPIFSHSITFQEPGKTSTSTTHLLHFSREEKFLLFELSADGHILTANIMLREDVGDDEVRSLKAKTIDWTVNWILHFMLHNM